MVILLQHTETLAFMDSNGRWNADRASAVRFEAAHEVLQFCSTHALTHVQLAYEFPDPEKNFVIRLADSSPASLRDQKPIPPGATIPPRLPSNPQNGDAAGPTAR